MDISVYYMYVRMFMCMSGVEDVYLHMYTFPRLWMIYIIMFIIDSLLCYQFSQSSVLVHSSFMS